MALGRAHVNIVSLLTYLLTYISANAVDLAKSLLLDKHMVSVVEYLASFT